VIDQPARLEIDVDAIALLRATLEDVQFDFAQQSLRPEFASSPFPHYENLSDQLGTLDPKLATALRLLSLATPVRAGQLESALGREFIEAGVVIGLLAYDEEADAFETGGYSIVSRLGQYFVVSTNPYYPHFEIRNDNVYMGPDSFTLANHLQRLAGGFGAVNRGLDLCTGGGIAGQSLAARLPGSSWTGIDLNGFAVTAANLNAELNQIASSYRAVESNLFAAVDGQFDLIVANPPFIPAPEGHAFPVYGNGGEDGLLVLRPLIANLGAHLSETGTAVIYGEGLGDDERLLIEDHLDAAAARDRLDFTLTIFSDGAIERALYTLGVMLNNLKPSRLEEIVAWRDLFQRQAATRYAKFIVTAKRGAGSAHVRSLSKSRKLA
jgi:hypothetical protein